ncbi:histidinol-phosphatase [Desulfobacterales bacterium HSG17]|nr:histidinol-phosphatase [Desulfobacterales bacterium HSG17]
MTICSKYNTSVNSRLIDYHIHTGYSKDGKGKIIEHCKAAVKNGFTEICFTDHHEWTSVAKGYYDYALRKDVWQQVIAEIETARNDFPMLSVKLGCELGYYREYLSEIIRFTKQHPFDYIIGSLHFLDDKVISTPGILENENPKRRIKWMRKYLSTIKEMVDNAYFDCLGHLDAVKKHTTTSDIEEYMDIILDIANSMKKNNIGFELNTSGWQHPVKECYPSVDILKILKDTGIRIVTIGSDSHSSETLGHGIKKGMEILYQVGFDSICTFSNRKPTWHPLANFYINNRN